MEMACGPLAGQNTFQFCLGPFTLRVSKRLKVLWARERPNLQTRLLTGRKSRRAEIVPCGTWAANGPKIRLHHQRPNYFAGH